MCMHMHMHMHRHMHMYVHVHVSHSKVWTTHTRGGEMGVVMGRDGRCDRSAFAHWAGERAGGVEGGRGVGGVLPRGEDARRKVAVSEGAVVEGAAR